MSKVRIRLKAYDHKVLDDTASKIVTTIKRIGGEIRLSFRQGIGCDLSLLL